MTSMTCKINGCDNPSRARGMCRSHHQRWRRGGDLNAPLNPRARSAEERIAKWTEKSGECLIWNGNVLNSGYGQMRDSGRMVLVHRWAWSQVNGPIPDEMQIDHICHNRLCVNPDHLRLATAKQNAENKISARMDSRSGVRGVQKTANGTWHAYAGHNGQIIHGGTFDRLEDAEAAAIALRNKLFTHNNADRAA